MKVLDIKIEKIVSYWELHKRWIYVFDILIKGKGMLKNVIKLERRNLDTTITF